MSSAADAVYPHYAVAVPSESPADVTSDRKKGGKSADAIVVANAELAQSYMHQALAALPRRDGGRPLLLVWRLTEFTGDARSARGSRTASDWPSVRRRLGHLEPDGLGQANTMPHGAARGNLVRPHVGRDGVPAARRSLRCSLRVSTWRADAPFA
jgi:hypothetical protein